MFWQQTYRQRRNQINNYAQTLNTPRPQPPSFVLGDVIIATYSLFASFLTYMLYMFAPRPSRNSHLLEKRDSIISCHF